MLARRQRRLLHIHQLSCLGARVASHRKQAFVQRYLPDARPEAPEHQVSVTVLSNEHTRIDGIGASKWVFIRALSCPRLHEQPVVRPAAGTGGLGCGDANGTVTASGVTDGVEAVVRVVVVDGLRGPGGFPVALGDHTVRVEDGAGSFPRPVETGSLVDANMPAHTVRVVRAIDVDDARIVDFQVRRMCGWESVFRLRVRVWCLFRLLWLLCPLRGILRYASA